MRIFSISIPHRLHIHLLPLVHILSLCLGPSENAVGEDDSRHPELIVEDVHRRHVGAEESPVHFQTMVWRLWSSRRLYWLRQDVARGMAHENEFGKIKLLV
jgi:hypothetical protein